MKEMSDGRWSRPEEVVRYAAELIQIDSSNWGDSDETVGEAAAADYCASVLSDAGWSPEVFTTTSDSRRGVFLRIAGTDSGAPALIVHAHLDTVPAIASEWSRPPFGGVVDDGCIWGRGAVDMKDMIAMILAVLHEWAANGDRPRRDVIVLLLPDEEAGSHHGAEWLVRHRPDFLEGATEAIGEVGAFSVTVTNDVRLYPIQVAEKGVHWVHLRAIGTGGHGSLHHPDNPIARVAGAISRISEFEWPTQETGIVSELISRVRQILLPSRGRLTDAELLALLGSFGTIVEASRRTIVNPTMIEGGFKANVVPSEATALIDARTLPGHDASFMATVTSLAGPRVQASHRHFRPSVQAPHAVDLVAQMEASLRTVDPGAMAVPYLMPASTDAKALSAAGISCYGFTPLLLPRDMEYWELFHRADERVPVDGLIFGTRVLSHFLLNA
jgi:acetylornithine deacetylase/succinyl-diaminopimelate desuccinylase-like protein